MALGLAAALLVFTGLWHVFEWAVHGWNPDTAKLIPFGVAYLVLGVLIATATATALAATVALILTAIGMTAAFLFRRTLDLPAGVIWAFILVDVVIVLGLLSWALG